MGSNDLALDVGGTEGGPGTPSPRGRRRLLALSTRLAAVAAAAGIILGVQALPASAAPNFGDCTLSVWLDVVKTYTALGNRMDVRAASSMPCTSRHATTSATVHLKRGFVVTRSASTTFTNSYGLGTRQLITEPDSRRSGCDYYQAVLSVTVSGLGSTYATTGSPVWLCI